MTLFICAPLSRLSVRHTYIRMIINLLMRAFDAHFQINRSNPAFESQLEQR